ncbi:hypothetical protein WICPIJ_008494 [Wickerhamomyces pijperi]|uniref:Structural maintenance of chromosomes protein n=1 Tax=Wickerhamomyces pijperi TaxID=599730 RepID=A0A9P8PWL8_WICPI|nr:hypothetical protein WICPIJ_008494 [Wickerhamomyces pijperi]
MSSPVSSPPHKKRNLGPVPRLSPTPTPTIESDVDDPRVNGTPDKSTNTETIPDEKENHDPFLSSSLPTKRTKDFETLPALSQPIPSSSNANGAPDSPTRPSSHSGNLLGARAFTQPTLRPNSPLKLKPTSSLLISPSRNKASFSGPDMVTLSPLKNKRALTENHYATQEKNEPVTRLVINKLVLNNFKSYAGEQVIGPFHTSFSAVIGPNGSGKSNVIDSMLFVFGFRANKMRQGKLSELIHNSENAPNCNSCSVDIHFIHVTDNLDSTTTVIEGSELVVTRRAFRNNSSKYYINNKESNYTQVTTLLKEKGIDLDHKRFLILQGEVESIAQMKPKAEKENDDGLLEYLEDIIGTSGYKVTIEESYQKIEEFNEICQEKENRFGLVEKERTALEPEKDKALEFLTQEKKLLENKSLLFQYEIHRSNKKIQETEAVLNDAKASLKEKKTKSSDFEKEVASLEEEHKNLSITIQEITTNISALEQSGKKSERDKVALEEKIKSLESKKKKSEKLLTTALNALKDAETKKNTITEEDIQFNQELSELKVSLVEEKAKLDEMRIELAGKTKDLNGELAEYERQLSPWNDKLTAKQTEITIAESEVAMLKERLTGLENEIKSLESRVVEIHTEIESNDTKYATLKREKVHVKDQVAMGAEEITQLSRHIQTQSKSLSELRQRALEARSNLSQTQNKSKVLSSLLRLQETGRIHGFHGRLGDLGYIDDRYDVAVTTACGRLDDMVVETVETAQQCIEYLRKNGGFASFIVLGKLRQFDMRPIQTPNNVPRLFDLIKVKDPKFSSAFYYALKDTLVARDMREANQVAYGKKRYRVVTLDGKTIDISGTLSGGGNTVARGGMKSTPQTGVSQADVLVLEKQLSEDEAQYQEMQNQFYMMENALKEFKERDPAIDNELAKLGLENDSLRNELKNTEIQIVDLRKENEKRKANHHELDAVMAKIKKLQGEYDGLKSESKEIQDHITALQDKIMAVGGVKLKLQKSTVDGINEKIGIHTLKLSHNSLALKKLANDFKRFTKSQTEKKEEIEKFSADLKELQSKLSKISDSGDEVEKKVDDLKAKMDDDTIKLEELKDTLDSKSEEINKLRSEEIEIENKIEKYESSIRHERRNREHHEQSYKSLEVRDLTNMLQFIEDEEELAKYSNPQLSELTPDEIEALDIGTITGNVAELEDYMANSATNVDLLEEYGRRHADYALRKTDLNESVSTRNEMRKQAEELKKKRLDQFMEGFNIISTTLKEMYQMITMGGNAELELVDSLDPFSEGILFSVMPPKKSWKNISNLSGGEKTLSSLALVFALHKFKPTPLYVMDEIDAALDFRNVSIVANYIKERTKNAQFIVISLRNNMFELSERLVGIYKTNNMTKSVALDNTDMLTRS